MRKVILLISFVLLLSMAQAAYTDNILFYMSCDDSVTDDISNSNQDANASSEIILSDSQSVLGGSSCYSDNSGDNYVEWNDAPWNSITGSYSVCAWVFINESTSAQGHGILAKTVWGSNGHGEYNTFYSGTNMYPTINTDGTEDSYTNGITAKTWNAACFVYDTTANQHRIYVDGVLRLVEAATDDPDDTGDTLRSFVYFNGNTHAMFGFMDEYIFWDRAITDDSCSLDATCGGEVATFYNEGTGYNPFGLFEVEWNLTDDLGVNTNPWEITYNTSVGNGSSLQYDCGLYFNGTLVNETINGTTGTETTFYIDTTAKEIKYSNVSINCSTSSGFTDEQIVYDVTIDTVDPNIRVYGFSDGFIFYKILDTQVRPFFSANDTILFAANLTIFNSSGSVINTTSETNISGTSALLNLTALISSLDVGRYEAQGFATDGHTAKEIKPDWETKYLDDGFQVLDDITIYGPTVIDSLVWFDQTREDRYKFKITFEDDLLEHTIYLKTTDQVHYMPDTNYMGHFVYWPLKKWIDFESPSISYVDSTYVGENTWKLDVFMTHITDEIEFDSLGDLNVVNESIYFNVTEGFTFTAKDDITNDQILNFSIVISNGSTILFNGSSNAFGNLTVNVTGGLYTTNASSSIYSTNSTTINYSASGSFEWSLLQAESLFIFFRDEQDNALLNFTNVTLTVIGPDPAQVKTTSTGSTFIAGFTPGSYELRYFADGYRTRSFFTTVTSGGTQTLTVYTIKNGSSSLIVIGSYDEKGNPIFNATVSLLKFIVDNNAFTVVGMEKTDPNGEIGIYLEPNDEPYQIVLDKDGETIFSGNEQKIFSSSVILRVPLLSSYLKSSNIVYSSTTDFNISFNNNTGIISFFWNDPTGLIIDGCLKVLERRSSGETTIGPNCFSARTSTVTLNITPHLQNDSTYTAIAYIETNTTNSIWTVQTLQDFIRLNRPWEDFGLSGLYIALFLIISMFFLGITQNFAISVGYVVLSMFFLQLLGVTFFTVGMITFFGISGIVVSVVNRR